MGLCVLIDGPERLRVREIDLDVQIHDGLFRNNRSVYAGGLTTAWLEELREVSLNQCRHVLPDLDTQAHSSAWNTVVPAALADVITTAAGLGHSGAIIVLPDAGSTLVQIK